MTKMTCLHLASPFAFSMPTPVQASREDSGGASEPPNSETFKDPTPSLASNALEIGDAASSAIEGEGFEASVTETVLRRYREQDGAASPPGTASNPGKDAA